MESAAHPGRPGVDGCRRESKWSEAGGVHNAGRGPGVTSTYRQVRGPLVREVRHERHRQNVIRPTTSCTNRRTSSVRGSMGGRAARDRAWSRRSSQVVRRAAPRVWPSVVVVRMVRTVPRPTSHCRPRLSITTTRRDLVAALLRPPKTATTTASALQSVAAVFRPQFLPGRRGMAARLLRSGDRSYASESYIDSPYGELSVRRRNRLSPFDVSPRCCVWGRSQTAGATLRDAAGRFGRNGRRTARSRHRTGIGRSPFFRGR